MGDSDSSWVWIPLYQSKPIWMLHLCLPRWPHVQLRNGNWHNKNRILAPPQDWLDSKPEFHAIDCLLLRHTHSVCLWGVCKGFPSLCGTLLRMLILVESPSLYKRHGQPSSMWPSSMTESVELLVFKRFTAHQEKQRNLGALSKPSGRDKLQTASENVGLWHRNAAGWVL